MPRIGVFICHCGSNIAGTVNIDSLVKSSAHFPDVALSVDYKYMCSDPGQKLIHEAIKEHALDGVVIASCSPRLHEITFRNTCEAAGLNPYKCEIANIREQCSWVHRDMEKGTEKALQTLDTLVEKIRLNESLVPIEVPVTKRALLIGGGISGMEAALSIADSGHEAVLVERELILGGNSSKLSYTWLIQESSPCIISSEDHSSHPFRDRGIKRLCWQFQSLHPRKGDIHRRLKVQFLRPMPGRLSCHRHDRGGPALRAPACRIYPRCGSLSRPCGHR
jgi:heterodisulfide reductase subunit A